MDGENRDTTCPIKKKKRRSETEASAAFGAMDFRWDCMPR